MIPPLLDLRHLRVEICLLSMSLIGLVDGLLWLAPNLVTMFIAVKDQKKPLMVKYFFSSHDLHQLINCQKRKKKT
jgi:hypothetical protein